MRCRTRHTRPGWGVGDFGTSMEQRSGEDYCSLAGRIAVVGDIRILAAVGSRLDTAVVDRSRRVVEVSWTEGVRSHGSATRTRPNLDSTTL